MPVKNKVEILKIFVAFWEYMNINWPNPSTFGRSLNLETYHLPATTIYLWTIHANEVSHYLTSQHVVANACIELDISYSI